MAILRCVYTFDLYRDSGAAGRSAKVGLGTVTQERFRLSLSEFYLFISFIICPLFLMFLPTGGVACSSGLRNYCTIEQGPLCCERGISSRLSSRYLPPVAAGHVATCVPS